MAVVRTEALVLSLLAGVLIAGCSPSGGAGSTTPVNAASAAATAPKPDTSPAEPNADGTIPSGTGTERVKPAAGRGNVQGRVLYNEEPVAGIEVRLCEKFNRFMGGCSGPTFTTKTDANGEYVIKDVPPKVYETLLVRVFDSDYYSFVTSGILQAAKYRIEPDRTFFAPDTNLVKRDLKLTAPKAGSKVAAEGIQVKWSPYANAAYYKLSIHPDSSSGAKTEFDYIGKRVDGDSFELDKPLAPGTYRCKVEAYNDHDVQLAQSAGDIEFTVK